MDVSGNVYIVEEQNNRVLKETLSAGGYIQSVIANSATNGLIDPLGVAVDASGNVYIADTVNNRVLKETLSAGSYTQTVIANAANNGLAHPEYVAVDSSGNVYVVDYQNDRVLKETLSAGGYTQSIIANAVNNGLSYIGGVAVDGSDNVYIADTGNVRVLKEDFADPPSLTFAFTAIGSTSSDSPQSVTVENIGNLPLDAVAPGLAFTSPSFAQVAGPATQVDCTSTFALAPGADCNISISFTPKTLGSISGSLVLTDNALNVSGATQTVSLTGTGKATPIVTVTPSSSSVTTVQALSVTVNVSGGSGNPTPTGSVMLTSGGYTSAATPLTGGSASIVITAGSLPVGADTLTATYTSDATSSPIYNNASNTVSVTVTVPTFTVTGTAAAVVAGATTGNTSTITVTPVGGFTGSVTLTASVSSSPAGAQNLPTLSFGTTTPVSITSATAGTATLTISTTASSTTPCNAANQMPRGLPWQTGGGAILACILLFGIPMRRSRWKTMLGMIALLGAMTGGLLACGGGGTPCTPVVKPGTTAGTYTITVTGTSGTLTPTGTVTLTVQ